MARSTGPGDLTAATDGHPGELIMETKAGTRLALPSKVPYQKAVRGDRLLAYGPSGGGYGDPFRRDPAAVLDNVLDGLLSAEIARAHYGVVDHRWRRGRGGDRTSEEGAARELRA